MKLPELDDKRYRQIFDEAVARIPTLTNQWTDHNPQDTGIMLLELLAAMTEMQNFYLDQVGDRFYEPYLELVTERVSGETVQERIGRFARQCAQTEVAVTARDYEQLALHSPFVIERAKASFDSGYIRLVVYRQSGALDDTELEKLREWLEPYRLLTTRLKLEQVSLLAVDIVCRVTMNAKLGRESACREKLEVLFRRMIQEKAMDEVLNLNSAKLEILSMQEIVRIDELAVCDSGRGLLEHSKHGMGLMQVQSVKILFTS